MREFSSPGEFARFLSRAAALAREGQTKGLERASELFVEEAKSEIGHYQASAGPFPEWERLSPATLDGYDTANGHHFPGKIELGYAPPDNPLLREADLRESIKGAHDHAHAVVGSNSDVAFWQELGTKKMPARSFLGRAVFRKAHEAAKIVLKASLGSLGRYQ